MRVLAYIINLTLKIFCKKKYYEKSPIVRSYINGNFYIYDF